jgi:hypothetical protein
MNLIKKILLVIGLVTLGLTTYSQGPYHEDVGNGTWTIIERIRSIKALRFADGTTQTTASANITQTVAYDSSPDTLLTYTNNGVGFTTSILIRNRTTIASDSIDLTDAYTVIRTNVATANNLTLRLNAATTFPIGSQITIEQWGTGQTTIVAESGVTINSYLSAKKIAGQYAGATLYKTDTNTWWLFGNLTN